MSKNVRIKVDLTKKRFSLLSSANEYVKNVGLARFCYAGINCRLKVKWNDENRQDSFSKDIEDLQRLIEESI